MCIRAILLVLAAAPVTQGMLSSDMRSLTSDSFLVAIGAVESGLATPRTSTMMLLGMGTIAAFVAGGRVMPYLSPKVLSFVVCTIYVVFLVTIDISIAVQRQKGGFAFNPMCAILTVEAAKLGLSLLFYFLSWYGSGRPLVPNEFSLTDVYWLLIPAVVFTFNNVLVWWAISANDMASFVVFRDTMVVWTAIIWVLVFQTPLGKVRSIGIAIILAGVMMNRIGSSFIGNMWSWAFVWVLLMTFCNASASVVNEKAMKRNRGLDINIQNSVLYFGCIGTTLFVMLLFDHRSLTSPAAFFDGFTNKTFITIAAQVLAGLMVSRLLKHADAVMKNVSWCLRGPTVVLVAPFFLTTPIDRIAVCSVSVVAIGCFMYLSQGPMFIKSELPERGKFALA